MVARIALLRGLIRFAARRLHHRPVREEALQGCLDKVVASVQMVISAKGCGVHLDVLAPPGDHQVGHDAIEVVEQAVAELIPLWVGIALEHVVAHHGIVLADAVQIVIAHQRRMAVVDGPQ